MKSTTLILLACALFSSTLAHEGSDHTHDHKHEESHTNTVTLPNVEAGKKYNIAVKDDKVVFYEDKDGPLPAIPKEVLDRKVFSGDEKDLPADLKKAIEEQKVHVEDVKKVVKAAADSTKTTASGSASPAATTTKDSGAASLMLSSAVLAVSVLSASYRL